jgi:vanillate monooxygenase ferredoxin subunit
MPRLREKSWQDRVMTNSNPPADGATFRALIAARTLEAEDIVSFELHPLDGETLPRFEAGSHVDLRVTPEIVRQYSISNDPRETHRYRLAVLAEPNSRGGSVAVHDGLPVGATVTIGLPRNLFRLDETAARSILLAGGIGITPLLAMAYRLLALERDFELHYCVRNEARLAFKDELTAGPLAARISIHRDDGSDEQRFVLARTLARPSAGAHLYVCGPAGFIDFVTAGAQRLGWPAERVHIERFSADVDLTGDGFTVITSGGLAVEVPPGKSIVEVLREHGIDVPTLCEQGVCGTCLTPVLEGIPDHRDLCQSDAEKASNAQITLCCSRSKTPRLVIDI